MHTRTHAVRRHAHAHTSLLFSLQQNTHTCTHLVWAVVHLKADAARCCAPLLVWVVHHELHILSNGCWCDVMGVWQGMQTAAMTERGTRERIATPPAETSKHPTTACCLCRHYFSSTRAHTASARLRQEWLTCVDGHCCLQHSLDTDTLGQALLHTPADRHTGRQAAKNDA